MLVWLDSAEGLLRLHMVDCLHVQGGAKEHSEGTNPTREGSTLKT